MTLSRSDIVQVARSFLGVKWKHQGRDRAGVDCVGLIYAVGKELEVVPEGLTIPPYRTQPDASLLEYFDKHMRRIPVRAAREGSAIIFGFGPSPHHAGILVDVNSSAIVHAHAAKKAVVMDHLESRARGRTILRAFDFKGLDHG